MLKDVQLCGPASILEAAKKYIEEPESLSHDVRTALGYVYREYVDGIGKVKLMDVALFGDYALSKWRANTLPTGVLD